MAKSTKKGESSALLKQECKQLKQTLESVYFSNMETNNSLAIILAAAEFLIDNPDAKPAESNLNLRIIVNAVQRIKIILQNSEQLLEPFASQTTEETRPIRLQKFKKPINVLVVDDDPQFRHLLDKALEKVGYTVMTAVDGVEAFDLFQKNRFDLVITDVLMPNVDGIELVKSLKNENPWVPVILISGFEEESTIRKKLKRDDIYFLKKPFSLHDLERVIEKILNL
ncbi:MAG: response regulator [Calditrichaeota bacterium]|nr:response regulator [Calditrichota bacterium]